MENVKIKRKENFFRNVVGNSVILLLVLSVFLLSFKSGKNLKTVSNSEYNGTIYAGDKTSKNVSLMINVYWGTEYVVQMLDIFKKNNIKTTFFIGGTWAKENPEILKRIFDEGHEIGSHGYSHKEHGKFGYDVNYDEINKTHKIIKQILNIDMTLFAPPGGSYNSSTVRAATNLGYKTIMWTRDTIDWRDKNTDLIFSRAITNLQGGDLILMHPTKCTVQALEKIIPYFESKGLKITTVSGVLWLNC